MNKYTILVNFAEHAPRLGGTNTDETGTRIFTELRGFGFIRDNPR